MNSTVSDRVNYLLSELDLFISSSVSSVSVQIHGSTAALSLAPSNTSTDSPFSSLLLSHLGKILTRPNGNIPSLSCVGDVLASYYVNAKKKRTN